MARRTVRQAKEWLEGNATALNPVAFAQFQREIQAVEGEHVANATRAVDTEAAAFAEEHRELLTDGCGIRDDYEQLAKDAATGRLSAKEYRERLDKLNQEVPGYSSRAERLAQKINTVETIETDPVAYGDRLYEKMPALQKPDFSF